MNLWVSAAVESCVDEQLDESYGARRLLVTSEKSLLATCRAG